MTHFLRTLIASTSLIATLAVAADPLPLVDAEVRKVDTAAGKITLKHGDIPNLDMPAMTMVFTATDKKLLDGLKEGDKVRFNADKKNGSYVVTALQAVR